MHISLTKLSGGTFMNRPSILVVGSMNMDLLVYGVPRIAGYG